MSYKGGAIQTSLQASDLQLEKLQKIDQMTIISIGNINIDRTTYVNNWKHKHLT